jgi:hypothetical protein
MEMKEAFMKLKEGKFNAITRKSWDEEACVYAGDDEAILLHSSIKNSVDADYEPDFDDILNNDWEHQHQWENDGEYGICGICSKRKEPND